MKAKFIASLCMRIEITNIFYARVGVACGSHRIASGIILPQASGTILETRSVAGVQDSLIWLGCLSSEMPVTC